METEDDVSAFNVLEYYRKYSQDKNLASYFCGSDYHETVVSEPPPAINTEQSNDMSEEQVIRPPLIGQGQDDSENEVVRISSPASSVTSNRRLEWDNGADIGYDNCHKQKVLHKSLSMPTLIVDDLSKTLLRLSPEGKVTENIIQTNQKETNVPLSSSSSEYTTNPLQAYQSSSSSSYGLKPAEIPSSTDSECDSEVKTNVLKFLHETVGLPVAASTPVYKLKEINYKGASATKGFGDSNLSTVKLVSSTTSVVDNIKEIKNGYDVVTSQWERVNESLNPLGIFERNSPSYRKQKLSQLIITAPLIVECLDCMVEVQDKDMQTTLVPKISVGIQTEIVIEDDRIKSCIANRQNVIFFQHSNSEGEPNTRSLGTNTLSDQDCNSFEYLSGDRFDEKSASNSIADGSNLKRSQVRSDLTRASDDTLSSNASYHTSPLGDIIANGKSDNSVGKNLDLIQKLIKSKKYDKVTKQYYIKKIIQNVLNSNDNSGASANSDLTTADIDKFLKENMKPYRSEEQQRNLQENWPWLPVSSQNIERFPRCSKQLDIRTFSTEILPEVLHSKSSQMKKSSVFTLPNYDDSKYSARHKFQSSSDRSSIPISTGASDSDVTQDKGSSGSFKNWKEEKTLSEKQFEEQSSKDCRGDAHSDGDVLLTFAKKERENQINWINNEITHLSKLKSLLQKNDYKVEMDVLTKPHVEDMRNVKKSTSVYVITTEKPDSPETVARPLIRSAPPSTSPPRKELINVKVASHEHESRIWYKNGERYGKQTYCTNANPALCKCVKPEAKSQVPCTNETCPTFNPHLRKSASPRRELNKRSENLGVCLRSELKNGKLVSSELYGRGTQPYTCIRRYVFEIPVPSSGHDKTTPQSEELTSPNTKQLVDTGSEGKPYSYADKGVAHKPPDVGDKKVQHVLDSTDKGVGQKSSGVTDKTIQHIPNRSDSYTLTEIHGDHNVADKHIQHVPHRSDSSTLTSIHGDQIVDKNVPGRSDSATLTEIYGDQKGVDKKTQHVINTSDTQTLTKVHGDKIKRLPKKVSITDSNRRRKSDSDDDDRRKSWDDTSDDHGKSDSTVKDRKNREDTSDDNRKSDSTIDESDQKRRDDAADKSRKSTRKSDSTREDSKRHKDWDGVSDDNRKSTPRSDSTMLDSDRHGQQKKLKNWDDVSDENRKNAPRSDSTVRDSDRHGQQKKLKNWDDVSDENRKNAPRSDSTVPDSDRHGQQKKLKNWDDDSDENRKNVPRSDSTVRDSDRHGQQKKLKNWDDGSDENRKDASRSDSTVQDSDRRDQKRHKNWDDVYDETRKTTQRSVSSVQDLDSRDEKRTKNLEDISNVTRRVDSDDGYDKRRISSGDISTETVERARRKSDKDVQKGDTKSISSQKTDLRETGTDSNRAKRSVNGKGKRVDDKKKLSPRKVGKPERKSDDTEKIKKDKTAQRVQPKDDDKTHPKVAGDEKSATDDTDSKQHKENKRTNTDKHSDNKLTQTTSSAPESYDKQLASYSSSSSSSSYTSSSDSSYSCLCPCCKINKSRASALVSNLQRDIQPLLCQPCYTQYQQQGNSYPRPGNVCNCYTVLKTETVQQIKRTVDELDTIERDQQYCTCSVNRSRHVKCCSYCDYKRKGGRKNGMAYMLTFEQGDKESDEETKRRHSLEEIKIKIPHPYKKKNKDNENKRKRARKETSPSRRKHHHHRHHHHKKHPKAMTLQEHLSLNRPKFIENAEQRRKCMIELAYMREERCQKYKQLLALSDGVLPPSGDTNNTKSTRLFSSKAMKQITAQRYKKLPEVQQKLKDNRDKQTKKANRLLADIFNKKLRENVLKGRHTLSASTSVIKLI